MKKLTIKLKSDQAHELSNWIDHVFQTAAAKSFSDKCLLAVIKEWQRAKLAPMLDYHFAGTGNLKLSAPVALALAHFIERTQLDAQSYIGNRLIQLIGEVDQQFK